MAGRLPLPASSSEVDVVGAAGAERKRAAARKAVRPGLKVAWYPGTVRPYESIYGIAAKFCIVNRVKPWHFVEWADSIAPSPYNQVPGEYWERWSVEAILKALGEPARLVETVGLRFGLTASRRAHVPPSGVSDATKFCGVCLGQGFHSALHGEYLLRRCFVHINEVLFRDPAELAPGFEHRSENARLDFIEVVSLLMKFWSGKEAPFPLPAPYRWPRYLLDHGSQVSVKVVISELYEQERRLSIKQREEADAQRAADETARHDLGSAPGHTQEPEAAPAPASATPERKLHPRGPARFEYAFENDDADAPGDASEGATSRVAAGQPLRSTELALNFEEQLVVMRQVPEFLLARAASCIAQDKWPIWRLTHYRVGRDLLKQHHSCKTVYESLDERDLHSWSWLRTEQVRGWDSLPGRLRLSHFETPCVRIDSQEVWADLLANLAEFFIPSGWRGTRIPPEEIEQSETARVEHLADELLEEFVRAFAWALYDTEPTVDLTSSRPNVRRNWMEMCRHYMPKYCLTEIDGGVRLQIQSRTPADSPNFVELDNDAQRAHTAHVRREIAKGSKVFPRRYIEPWLAA